MIKNLNELAVEVTKREGKKVELSISQIKEVLKIICDLMFEDSGIILKMLGAANKSARKKKK